LLVDLLLPLAHDPNQDAGREALGLTGERNVSIEPFRVRPGDEASCLNLYTPTSPRIFGVSRRFAEQGKPIGAICHGPWLLVEADLLRGRTATSWPSIRTDLRNAGATVVDEAAVTDGNIVTSRKPDDVEAFTNALIDRIEDMPAVEEIRHPSELPA